MAGNPDPIDQIGGLSTADDVAKGDMRVELKQVPRRFGDSSEVAATSLAGRHLIYVGARLYEKDTEDTTSEVDDLFVIVDGDGVLWKLQGVADTSEVVAAARAAAASSEDARDLAQQWATKTDDEVVSGLGYGAKKYALDAATDSARTAADVILTENARDAALYAQGIFPTVSDGLVAVSDGEYFFVPQSDDDTSFILYQRDSGSVATEIRRFVEAHEQVSGDAGLSVVDNDGNEIYGINVVGRDVEVSMPGWPFHLGYQWNLSFCYGQSQSRGSSGGQPVVIVSSVAIPGGLKFAGGVRPDDGGTDPGVIYASFDSLTETSDGSQNGETPVSGSVAGFFMQWLNADGTLNSTQFGDAVTATGQKIAGAAPGLGGLKADELKPGTDYFTRMEAQVDAAATLADAGGKSVGFCDLLYDQGDADQGAGTAGVTYRSTLMSIRDTLESKIRASFDNDQRVHMFIVQTSEHPVVALTYRYYPQVALSQLRLSRENNDYSLLTPRYFMPPASALNVHFSGVCQRWTGEYWGLARKMLLIDKVKWRPLSFKSKTIQGKIAIVELDNQSGTQCVIDTTMVADYADGSKGIQLVDPTKSEVSSTITITSGSPATVNWTGHGLSNGQRVRLETTGTFLTGLDRGIAYYVVNKATDTFQLALTEGGSAINTSGTQSGTQTAIALPIYNIASVEIVGRNKLHIRATTTLDPHTEVRAGWRGTSLGPLAGARTCIRDSATEVVRDIPGQTVLADAVTAWNSANPTLPISYPLPLYRWLVHDVI